MEAVMRHTTEERLEAKALQEGLQSDLHSCRCSSRTGQWLVLAQATHVGCTHCCLRQAAGPPYARIVFGVPCSFTQHGPARPSHFPGIRRAEARSSQGGARGDHSAGSRRSGALGCGGRAAIRGRCRRSGHGAAGNWRRSACTSGGGQVSSLGCVKTSMSACGDAEASDARIPVRKPYTAEEAASAVWGTDRKTVAQGCGSRGACSSGASGGGGCQRPRSDGRSGDGGGGAGGSWAGGALS